jgi:hypothetical protein
MRDLLAQGAAWLTLQLQRHASRPVTYRRGTEQVTVLATIGRKAFEVETGEGKVYLRSCDFLIPRVALRLAGHNILPERGDRIVVDFGSGDATFEILPSTGLQPWEFSDPYETLLRIHTERVT